MNNGRGESGDRRESHSVPLQWFSRDQSMTTTLSFLKFPNFRINSDFSNKMNSKFLDAKIRIFSN